MRFHSGLEMLCHSELEMLCHSELVSESPNSKSLDLQSLFAMLWRCRTKFGMTILFYQLAEKMRCMIEKLFHHFLLRGSLRRGGSRKQFLVSPLQCRHLFRTFPKCQRLYLQLLFR